ncbi:MAG: glycerate kinase [Deltaproteobacteria bacterium]|nr:glycerate kinase [Deltaproteobacteria bacterium]
MSEDLERMRKHALDIFKASIDSVNPRVAVHRALIREGDVIRVGGHRLDLNSYERIIVVGAGKASAAMTEAVEEILGDEISKGLVVVKYGYGLKLNIVGIKEAGHPIPDNAGLKGAREIVELLGKCGERDLVISLISGGGSALLPLPVNGISLDEKQRVTQVLLGCGASIHELNTVRKHLSLTKGGGLARAAFPATVINLMLSDVVRDDMDVIASGPFVPDRSTFADALAIIGRYKISPQFPGKVLDYLIRGSKGEVPETPKPGDHAFSKVINFIVGSNIIACKAAGDKARQLGYSTLILSSMIEGNTADVAHAHAGIAFEIARSGNPIQSPACIISGGETTVMVQGSGLGGRNQEFALFCAKYIAGLHKNIVILSGGTDGTDGPTDAAGGIVDPYTEQRGRKKGLDIERTLNENDAYHYLEATGDLIKTGPTLTNVMDIHLILVG